MLKMRLRLLLCEFFNQQSNKATKQYKDVYNSSGCKMKNKILLKFQEQKVLVTKPVVVRVRVRVCVYCDLLQVEYKSRLSIFSLDGRGVWWWLMFGLDGLDRKRGYVSLRL